MKEGPEIARLGALIGDPARANMLTALMAGHALTASELAREAGITLQTASSHLRQLSEAALVRMRKEGRHRYFAIADEDVAQTLETLMSLAEKRGLMRVRPGPGDEALRRARTCYDHLAGEMAVHLFDVMVRQDWLAFGADDLALTQSGDKAMQAFGIDTEALRRRRRPLCRVCLDWSMRRNHLAGSLGAALFDRFCALGWVRKAEGSRKVSLTPVGMSGLEALARGKIALRS